MADDIDVLAAAQYAHGKDAIDVAVGRVATLIDVRNTVLTGRQQDPKSFPGSGSTDKNAVARRVVASLLDAGWRPPSPEEVGGAAARSREFSERFDRWLNGLSPEQRSRAMKHFSENNDFPPDLRPPTS